MNELLPARKPLKHCLVSVVLPVYNEAAVLGRLLATVQAALATLECRYEIVFVNDGSHDDSGEILDVMAERDSRVRVVHFSRNFGHQAAVQAGLLHVDAVVEVDRLLRGRGIVLNLEVARHHDDQHEDGAGQPERRQDDQRQPERKLRHLRSASAGRRSGSRRPR